MVANESVISEAYVSAVHPFENSVCSGEASAAIFDIRRSIKEASLIDDIVQGLSGGEYGGKELPTLLLYDEKGLKLFEDITYLDEYYLTGTEIKVLERHASDIAAEVPSDSVLLELGSGNLRKVNILLQALEHQRKRIDYYALDVNQSELERTLAAVPKYNHVHCYGLLGTYDDGLEWLQAPERARIPKTVMSLGSSIGNFSRQDAAEFLKNCAEAAGSNGAVLLGIDGCADSEKVYKAYNDSLGVTHRFTLNGLEHANALLGKAEFRMKEWQAIGRYNAKKRCHQAFVAPKNDASVLGQDIKAGEEIRIEESYKYSDREISSLWQQANVHSVQRWGNQKGDYAMHLIAKDKYPFPQDPHNYASKPVPTWEEWQQLWLLWDTVTRQMIPDEELLEKPIKLRNACIFYLGHIPTFFDMKLTDTLNGNATEPKYYHQIFERGIDPDVEDPEQCHAHSDIPDQWPPLHEILTYQKHVRERVQSLYERGADADPKIGRCLWLGYEHEAMHLETLLYMLIQSEKTLPPTGARIPVWSVQAKQAEEAAVPNEWISIPEREMTLSMDDVDTDDSYLRYFGWDIEKPSRKVHVHGFVAKARPITIGEYARYMLDTGDEKVPASWAERGPETAQVNGHTNGSSDNESATGLPEKFLKDKYVRTVFGPVALADVLTWPVSASYDELAGCAAYMGGRIPTLEEARSIYAYADEGAMRSNNSAEERLGRTIPAVNSHLVNDGVEESPPSTGPHKDPRELFADLKGCNVGFQHWTPTPVADKGNRLCGQGAMGGVWEWTSTPLSRPPGYEPMPLYPAYSQDFFDGKHNIVLGGSWATVPRIAGRKSFINWYQRNYLYVWAGARIVKDKP